MFHRATSVSNAIADTEWIDRCGRIQAVSAAAASVKDGNGTKEAVARVAE